MSLLADLFSRSTDGVFAVDVNQRIVFWNAACERLLGTSAPEAMGRPCADVVHAFDESGQPFCKADCAMARLAEGGSAMRMDPLRFDNGRGKSQKLSVRTALVPSPQGDLWIVVHLLYRGEAADLSQQTSPQPPCMPSRRCNGKQALPSSTVAPLTSRERGILRLLAEGHKSSHISRQLCISVVTVRNHIQHLHEKLGVHSQLEAVAHAYRHNLI